MRLARLFAPIGLVTLTLTTGCLFLFDDKGDDVCALGAEPAFEPAPLRDPDTLTCQSFGGGCDPSCGPCPAAADLAPIPTWGVCGSSCDALDEASCSTDPACRVVKDAACSINLDCETDYVGCFPVDTQTDTSVNCFTADAWTCSRSNACTALHSSDPCGALTTDAQQCARPFELCVPEGTSPGECYGQVSCRAQAPACPSNTTPGIANQCYTGACIPVGLCPVF